MEDAELLNFTCLSSGSETEREKTERAYYNFLLHTQKHLLQRRKTIPTRLVSCYIHGITMLNDHDLFSLYSPQAEVVQLTEGTHRSEEPVSNRTLKT